MTPVAYTGGLRFVGKLGNTEKMIIFAQSC